MLTDSRPAFCAGLENLISAEKPRMEVVGHATTYAMALDLADRLQPDVILFSFFRDALDPLEVIAALTRHSDTRVLVIKGLHDDCPIAKAIEAGARGFVLAEDSGNSITRAIGKVQDKDATTNRVWAAGFSGYAAKSTSPSQSDPEIAKVARLTARERELICAIVENPSAKYYAVGAKLGISEHTVHNHLSSIYSKLGLINRLDLLVFALKNQITGNADAPGSHWADLN